MKFKDFIKVLDSIYHIVLYDGSDNTELFRCKSDSKALINYGDWEIVEIAISDAFTGCIELEICIKEGSADNE